MVRAIDLDTRHQAVIHINDLRKIERPNSIGFQVNPKYYSEIESEFDVNIEEFSFICG